MGYQLGVDLGTTYTAAAVCRSDDRRWVEPEVVTLGTRSATVPSVLFLAPDGSVVVGEAAERRALTDPDRVVREFKRRIGDSTPLVVAGRAWAPEELCARLVRWVVDQVADREGGPAARIAVTHPASWGPHKQDLLGNALAAQGLTVTFLAEPQAAALHYAAAERVEPGSTIAVYDLGGGTFDAAVVRKADPGRAARGAAGFGLLGRPEGLERLGGVDFDDAVFCHVRDGLPEVFADLDAADPAVLAAVSRVRRDCTEAKEALSSDTEVSIPVLLPGSRGSVRLHRSEFESLIRPQVEETVTALRAAVTSAGLTPDQLSAVLLVGGSSRIPLVSQLVSEQLGRPVAVDADPKNAIAKGAALSVSPRPTASWPGVAVAPVPAALGAAAAGAPLTPPPRPPQSFDVPRSFDDSVDPPTERFRGGPTHEPATALLSGVNADQDRGRDQSWDQGQEWNQGQEWDHDPDPRPRRSAGGLLVGVGGLLAVGALVAAVVLWPQSEDARGGGGLGDAPTAEAVPSISAPVEAPVADDSAPADTEGAGADDGAVPDDGGTSGDDGGAGDRDTDATAPDSGGDGTGIEPLEPLEPGTIPTEPLEPVTPVTEPSSAEPSAPADEDTPGDADAVADGGAEPEPTPGAGGGESLPAAGPSPTPVTSPQTDASV